MRTKRKNRNPHMAAVFMDMAHVVLCIGMVLFSVIIFLNPTQFQRFFPVVFILASAMQFLHGIPKILAYRRSHGQDRGLLAGGIIICILGVLLGAVAIASGITVWR